MRKKLNKNVLLGFEQDIYREAFARGIESAGRHLRRVAKLDEERAKKEPKCAFWDNYALTERLESLWCDQQATKVRRKK